MTTKIKTFKITSGGLGTEEVSRFISRTIGRDLSLIDNISAISLNSTTTEISLHYREEPLSSIQTSLPPNGFVASTGSPLETVFLGFSSPINENSLVSGNISVDGVNLTGSYRVEPLTENYILSIDLSGVYNPLEDVHVVEIDESLKTIRNQDQPSNTVFGYTQSQSAIVNQGYEEVYSSNDIRGTAKLTYARIDSSLNTTEKVKELVGRSSDLLAFATVQKTANTTEVFILLLDKAEPVVASVFPRQGANNPVGEPFPSVVLTFKDPINTTQVTTRSGLFAIYQSYGSIISIDPSDITVINSRSISFDVNTLRNNYGISSPFINIFVRPGLQSANGIYLTKGYVFGHSSSTFTLGGGGSGPQGPQGPSGPAGTDGEDGEDGSAWYHGTGVPGTGDIPPPLTADQPNNDYYIDEATADIYYRTGLNTWTYLINLSGAAGAEGNPGSGLVWQGTYNVSTDYSVYDAVEYSGSSYVMHTDATAGTVPTDTLYWDVLALGGADGSPGTDGDSFVWSGNWNSSDTYVVNDAVAYSGSSYLCILGNSNQEPSWNPPGSNTYWDLMVRVGTNGSDGLDGTNGTDGIDGTNGIDGADGTSFIWSGSWSNSNTYVINDAVAHSGSSYVCILGHSNQEPDWNPPIGNTYWDLMARVGTSGTDGTDGTDGLDGTSFAWQGAWMTVTDYFINDVVAHSGSSFICIQDHDSQEPDDTPADTVYWEVMAAVGSDGLSGASGSDGLDGTSFTWLGAWSGSTPSHSANDVVSHSGSSYICILTHFGSQEPAWNPPGDSTYWDLMAKLGSDGADGANGANGADGADGASFIWSGAWSNSNSYLVNDAVSHSGSSFICISAHSSEEPDWSTPGNTLYWDLMASVGEPGVDGTGGSGGGIVWRGEWNIFDSYDYNNVVYYTGDDNTWIVVAPSGAAIGYYPEEQGLGEWELFATGTDVYAPDPPVTGDGLVLWNGTGAKQLKDSGVPISHIAQLYEINNFSQSNTFGATVTLEAGYADDSVALSPTGTTYYPDFSLASIQTIDLTSTTGGITLGTPLNAVEGRTLVIEITANPSSNNSIALPIGVYTIVGANYGASYAGQDLKLYITRRGSDYHLSTSRPKESGNLNAGPVAPTDALIPGSVWLDTSSSPSTFSVGHTYYHRTITTNDTITIDDKVIFCNTDSGAITLSSIDASTYDSFVFIVKNIGTGSNAAILTGSGGFDGSPSLELLTQDSVTIMSDGSAWRII